MTTPLAVPLTQQELCWAYALGVARCQNKFDAGITSGWADAKHSRYESHVCGVVAELTGSKILPALLDTSISVHGDGRRGDLRLPDYRTVSVKGTWQDERMWDFRRRSGRFQDFKDHFGMLVFWPGGRMTFVIGWFDRQDWLTKAKLRPSPFDPEKKVAYLSMRDMRDIREFPR